MSYNDCACVPDPSVLFGPGRGPSTQSAKFEVKDKPRVLRLFDQSGTAKITVHACTTVCGEDFSAPAIQNCCPVELGDCVTEVVMFMPGSYYAVIEGADPEDVVLEHKQIDTQVSLSQSGAMSMACGKMDYFCDPSTGAVTLTGGAAPCTFFPGDKVRIQDTPAGLFIFVNNEDGVLIPRNPALVNNGDGTYTYNPNDGVTAPFTFNGAAPVDLYISNVTRAANQITVTRSDGQTWVIPDVNVSDFSVVGNVLRITETDGSTYDEPIPAAWSDVFTSYGGTTISFADGDTVNLSNLNEKLTRQADGTIDLVDDANNTSGTIPLWVANTVPSGVVSTDWGLGSIVNAADTDAMTEAEVISAAADLASTSIGMMRHVLTNRAEELGSAGMRNVDGSLGHFSRLLFTSAASFATAVQTALNYNGATLSVDFANGDTIVMPPAKYPGQLLRLRFNSTLFSEVILDASALANYAGTVRGSQHDIRPSSPTDNGMYIHRAGDIVDYVGLGGGNGWIIANTTLGLWGGTNWHENKNGTVTANFSATPSPNLVVPAGQELFADVALPLQMSNGFYTLQITDRNGFDSGTVLGVDPAPSSGQLVGQHYAQDSTGALARIALQNVGSSSQTPGTMAFHAYGVPDHTALGGIANF